MHRSVFASALFLFSASSLLSAAENRGRLLDRSGTPLAETRKGQRLYPEKALTAHLTGYLRSKDNAVGVAGLEKSLDETLGRGRDVSLTIDLRIQKIATEAFPEGKNGAVVVIDPRSGAILSLNSFPTFDPNDFIPTISQEKFGQYQNDPRAPLFNRAINPFCPGSTFKIPVALAVCRAGHHDATYSCEGGVPYGKKFMKCWIAGKPEGRHGDLNFSDAIKTSCNAWFYQASSLIGIDEIGETVKLLGLTQPTGCGLPNEGSGMIGTPARFEKLGMQWSEAYTAMTAIGQGLTEATPLQMASVAATLANGGKVFSPHLVRQEKVLPKTDLTREGIPDDRIELVRKAMWRIVNEDGGTGKNARSGTFAIAGKTGTPQTGNPQKPTDAWFIAFAPYEDPTLAIAVYVENARSGGSIAAPLAREILTRSLALTAK